LYSSPIIIGITKSRMKWAGHVERTGKRNAYRLLAGKSRGEEASSKTKTKMDFGDMMGWSGLDWCSSG
jgi:hypothetical protein